MDDNFVRDNCPPARQMPDFRCVPGQDYSEYLNVTTHLLDHWISEGLGSRPAVVAPTGTWTYAELFSVVKGYADTLSELGVVSGTRVLLRGWNTPALAALHLAVWRVGGVVVSTMPLLRASELCHIISKANISHAICENGLVDELASCQELCPSLRAVLTYSRSNTELRVDEELKVATAVTTTTAFFPTRADDPCLIAFTSGTTGAPKGAVHTHRDLLAICDTYARNVLKPSPGDVFVGSPPLAFTFGLGGLLLFPLRAGASTVLLPDNNPMEILAAIARYRATICFTAPTAYRAMLGKTADFDITSLRIAVSAGEILPLETFTAFHRETGLRIADGIGATEMLHIFISAAGADIRPGSIGRAVPGYEAAILDDDGKELPDGTVGWLAVKGPTGCRYLNDTRQTSYVRNGWNITGDACRRDSDGYFWYQSRMDDLIVSSGYKIAPAEVEMALLSHDAVAECAVVGCADDLRGQLVKAFVVLRAGCRPSESMRRTLQGHVGSKIAPYKYPREIEFVATLPRTQTGKIKRYALRYRDAA